ALGGQVLLAAGDRLAPLIECSRGLLGRRPGWGRGTLTSGLPAHRSIGMHLLIAGDRELRPKAEGRQRAAEGLGLGLLEVVAEIVVALGAPAGGGSTAGNADPGFKGRDAVFVGDQLGLDDRVRVLRAQPQNAPLDLEVIGTADPAKESPG